MPKSETALFYVGGVVSAMLGAMAASSFVYSVVVFPLYLAAVNGLQLVIMYRVRFIKKFIITRRSEPDIS